MTSAAPVPPAPVPPAPVLPVPVPIRVSEPADLVAAVPTLIGFRPRESLVLIALGGRSGRRIGLVLRVDLPPPEHVRELAEQVAASLEADAPDGAAVLVVGSVGDGRPVREDVASAVVEELEERGIAVRMLVWAERIEAGARWACLGDCRCTGALPDPAATPAAATAVAGGQVVRGDRVDLLHLVSPADPDAVRRREELLRRAADAARRGPDPGGGEVEDDAHLAVVEAALADVGTGRLDLDDDRAVSLATALVRPTVRDTVLQRCARSAIPGLAAAETLWAALCRALPDPESAEAAALLAATALLRGDGALANVALDRAEGSWPGHRLTGLLRSVASAGLRPSQVRDMLVPPVAAR